MAVRSGAGTGVIVGLVVFVITSVALLVLAIAFYAGQTDAKEQAAAAETTLATFIKPQQQNSDHFKQITDAAKQRRQSVTEYLDRQYTELMQYVNGDGTITLEQLRAEMARYGIEDDAAVRHAIEDMRRNLRNAQLESENLQGRLEDRENELSERRAEIDRLKEEHEAAIEEIGESLEEYRRIAEQYRADVSDAIQHFEDSKQQLEDQYVGDINDLEDEVDRLGSDIVVMKDRLKEYQEILDQIRIKAQSPDLLVDARVIDVDTSAEQVFINRGKADRIVLGMTFEVYDNQASLYADPDTGALPRGKASVQVVKVSESTSSCKVIRGFSNRPVVRGDVLANAVYDPEFKFKFLIHGKFDVDTDGRPSAAEAEYLRGLVMEWGGEVIEGESLPGDLDFLVLGVQPPTPLPLRPEATQVEIDAWSRQHEARNRYDRLFNQAQEAQIPVLNANRFFILIGHTER